MAVKLNRLLILGGSGFIGKAVVKEALLKNYKITIISFKKKKFQFNKVKYIYIDLKNYNGLYKKLNKKEFDYIINLSGNINHNKFENRGYEIIEDHFNGLVNVLSVINLKKIKKIIQIGTSDEYGNNKSPQKESTAFTPNSPYGIAKLYSHLLTKHYREAYKIFACNGILFNHESPKRGETFVTRKITIGLSKIKLGMQKKLFIGNFFSELNID